MSTLLGDNVAIEAVVDFGDLQIFEGVTTYPAILTLRKCFFLPTDDDAPLALLNCSCVWFQLVSLAA